MKILGLGIGCDWSYRQYPPDGISDMKIIWQNSLFWLNFAAHFKIVRQNPCIKLQIMKKGLHPENYRFVVFKDMSNGYSFLSRSSAPTRETVKWEDGNEYPLIKLEISNTSHPFFTGQKMLVDTAGRIDKFKKRYEKK
jgi:large subunit ribosomal protein L31